ncbi:sigma-70 family RNA polymerase sigma factor [Hymenobacter sp. RP-2-7]|uniref:Sigma-70 family RNA polymerase sigma factor n=1 Tax=Hymenobacter polaris TaxID=2682546 RepID=A0A7Y0AED4_9BACT|nr:sigma-70 family RNA polymerase sigma factor [Hymenobacter polaris]NML65766.1 sigma-70 family RNA polymerase sigma factor [Hymenobacter polaris]
MFFRRRPVASPPPAWATDQVVLARYRQGGDVAELGALYERYLPEVFAVCRRYLAPPDEDAQDATMQLFEHLVVKLRTHAPENFGAWLYATARNHCLMELRARQRGTASGGPLLLLPEAQDLELAALHQLPDALREAEETTQHEADLQALEAALGQLPPEQRRCLELFYLEEKSYAEIATLTALPLNLVKSHLQNGRRMLKRELSQSVRNC